MIKNIALFVLLLLFSFNANAQITTTWNGVSWNNGDPDLTTDVIFTGNFSSTGNLNAKSVLVSNGAQVTINNAHSLTIENNLTVNTDSKLTFENNASLIQNNAAATNLGNINYKRSSKPMLLYDYTYWSSPVSNQTLSTFSPQTASGNFYSFNATTNSWVNENKSNTMLPATGYIIQTPKNFSSSSRQAFDGEFIGIPNNGDYTVNLIEHDPAILNYNFIGNPYPSAISIDGLFDSTTIGALFIWTHNTGVTNNIYTKEDYAIRTWTTGTQAISGGEIPNDYIAAGQGFFASSSTNATFTFTNDMRVSGNNDLFFKRKPKLMAKPKNYYFWLNLTNTGGAFKQLALGYQEGATNNYDFGVDAAAAVGTYVSFYSLIGTNGYAIQGRAYPFNANDVIPLGYATTILGQLEIKLDRNDTFFNTQNIFLEDITLGVYHNLKNAPYTFNSEIGTFNNRFAIHYFDPNLSIDEYLNQKNNLKIAVLNNELNINSSTDSMKSVEIFDVSGKSIYCLNNENQNKITISNLTSKNETLIVKVVLSNNTIVSQKIIF